MAAVAFGGQQWAHVSFEIVHARIAEKRYQDDKEADDSHVISISRTERDLVGPVTLAAGIVSGNGFMAYAAIQLGSRYVKSN